MNNPTDLINAINLIKSICESFDGNCSSHCPLYDSGCVFMQGNPPYIWDTTQDNSKPIRRYKI